jgi:type IV pilus assembly protein PilV
MFMNKNYRNSGLSNRSTQLGATLIEILISIIILAIGMLGLAALQNTSLKFSYDSYLRSQASFLAYDLVDRIRANPDGGSYSLAFNETPNKVDCFAGDDPCSETEMRSFDLYYWRQQTEELLPDATVDVTFEAIQGLYTIRMEWGDRYENDVVNPEDTDTTQATKEFIYAFKVN